MRVYWVILCSMLFFSCQEGKKKMESVLLKHETVVLSDSLVMGMPMKLTCVDGNLVMLDIKSEAFFHWVRLPHAQYMGSFGERGQGPDQFLNIKSLHAFRDTLYAYDLYKAELVQVVPHQQRLLFKPTAQLPKGWTMDLLPLREGYYCGNGCYEQGMFQLMDATGKVLHISDDYPSRDENEAKLSNQVRFMAYQGCMDTNGKGSFVYLTAQSKQFHIYELQQNDLVKVAEHLESYPLYKADEGDGFSVRHDENALAGYRDVIADDDCFYALYSGRNFKEYQMKSFECTTLYVYDWKGALLKTYELDIPVTTICLDKQHRVFYAIANLPDPTLVKFSITD